MHFNKLDLNLLVALDALLIEGSISRAAARVNLSQSAMSNALARLRAFFEDDLLVQVGRTLELTPRARALKESVRDVLMRVETAVAAEPQFDPSRSDRTFQLLVSDYTTVTLMPHLLALARRQSSTVRFQLCPLPHLDQPQRALGRGEADMLVIPRNYCSPDHPVEPLFDEEYVCAVWNGSRFAQAGVVSKADYEAADHVEVQPSGLGQPTLDTWFLERSGMERRIEVRTFSFIAAPFLVLGTDRIATIQRRLGRMAQQFLPLTILEAPMALPRMAQSVQWHKYRSRDPGLVWLRGLLHQAVEEMDGPPQPALPTSAPSKAPAAARASASAGRTGKPPRRSR
jgi:LysR family nod box-dependent transcriptional activator